MSSFDATVVSGAGTATDRRPQRRSLLAFAVLALMFSVLMVPAAEPAEASSHVEEKPLVVALCHGSNQPWPENFPIEYYQNMFSETSGSETVADYWRDVSHGRFSIDGTLVLDVKLTDYTSDDIGDRDQDDFGKCKEGVTAELGSDWENSYAGPVVFKAQTEGLTLNSLTDDPSDNILQVQAVAPSVMDDWPAPPFTLVLTKTGTLWQNPKDKDTNKEIDTNFENTTVTAVDKDYTTNIVTFTLDRAPQEGYRHRDEVDSDGDPDPFPSVKSWRAGTTVKTISDVYGQKNRTAVVSADTSPSVINHEMGHFFGYDHSRRLSTADGPYRNCFDVMSTLSCTHRFRVPFSYPAEDNNYPAGTLNLSNGPGMVSPFLDLKNWIAAEDRTVFDPASCTQETFSMRALGLNGSDLHQIRVPTSMDIDDGVKSDYLTVELRSQQFHWDQGIPHDAFVLNLKGDDNLAYLVDDSGAGGTSGMNDGDYYVFDPGTPNDASDDRFFFVNGIDETNGTGEISLATCPFTTDVDYTGPTSFTYGTFSEVTAGLALTNDAPGPAGTVDFTLGSEDCDDFISSSEQEDGTGEAACDLKIDVKPGNHSLTAHWPGIDDVFEPAEDVVSVSVAKRATSVEVGEPTATYHDAVTLTATLTQAPHPDDAILTGINNAAVTLSLGAGAAAQSCDATTNSSGYASCQIDSVEQTPGSVPVSAEFAGNDFYLATSDSSSITVLKRATELTLTGPQFTAVDGSITLTGTLVEADTAASDGEPIAGREVTLTLGDGADAQSCDATTNMSGVASCSIDDVDQQLGSQPISADFDGDDYYLPSSDEGELIVFEWTAGGHFVIGDGSAGVDAEVTFWSSEWYLENTVSGALTTDADSFKGFAHDPSGPTSCAITDWTSLGGNSSDPAVEVPEYTPMLVTDTVAKTGPDIKGSTVAIAIVKVDPGYQPDPGHEATGTVVGYLCGP